MNFSAGPGRWTSGAALVMALLAGCGGSGGGSDTPAGNNTAPVATMVLSGMIQAGGSASDVSASTGSELNISGSTSTDLEGDVMTYAWSLTKPSASVLALVNAAGVTQTIKPDAPGVYVMTLRVADSKGAFSEKAITITVRNNVAPVTNVLVTATYAGVTTVMGTQGLNVGSSVVLDAAGSTDADGDAVNTVWTMLEKPANSQAGLTLDGATSHFVADLAGVYKVRARGTDASNAYSDAIYVFDANNTAPKTVVVTSASVPGPDGASSVSAPAGYIVSLNGYDSRQSYGADATYLWTLVSKPARSASALTVATAFTQITPDVLGDYVVRLTITNAAGAISSHTTTIAVTNRSPLAVIQSNVAPVAIATAPAVRLSLNTSVTLRSANSVDADGDALTYAWTLASKPGGSATAVSAATGASVQMTPDLPGTYVVTLRATDPSGAFSEQSMTFQAGSHAPVAVVDKSFSTVLLGGAATAAANMSFDVDSGALSYAWAIDSAPAGSSAAIAAPASSTLSFTPDVAGNYVASVTVSDGVNTNVAYVTIRALPSLAANVELGFVPLDTRYSKGLDQLVILATNPNAVKIVDPFTGLVKTVMLPLAGKALNLSPNGKLAAVLHEGVVSLIDLEAGTMLRSSSTGISYSETLADNGGRIYLVGRGSNQSSDSGTSVIDGRTGADLSTTLGSAYSSLSVNYRGLFSSVKNRAFFVNGNYSSSVSYFDIDAATGKVGTAVSVSTNYAESPFPLQLSENHDLLFTSGGNYFRTDTLAFAGKLLYTGNMQSLSHSSQNDETVLMLSSPGVWPDYQSKIYAASYKRYVGALFLPDADLTLPAIGGAQSYGIQIYHSASGKHVALVQTGSSAQFGTGARYYVLAR